MKTTILFAAVFGFFTAVGQQPEVSNPVVATNGDIRVEGVDELGGRVVVVYNKDHEKIYQERTFEDATTFAKFNDGTVVEYGTIYKPTVALDLSREND